jgi:predicted HTH transcriptional regulator
MIEEGEHQKQDFKFCINDSRKIARTLVAFANTDGGRLLIGVKDNGVISGIKSDEEYYMAEAAAKLYSKPQIPFKTKQWVVEGKTVLEVIIKKSTERPHYAEDEQGKWLAYIRKDDENILANRIMLEVWKREKSVKGVFISFTDDEKELLRLLEHNESISISKYARKTGISRRKAERILINLVAVKVVTMDIKENRIVYRLQEDFSYNDDHNNFMC